MSDAFHFTVITMPPCVHDLLFSCYRHYMTANLHPYVYQARIVKESEYPDISYATINPVVVANNYVMVSGGDIISTYKSGTNVTLGVLRPQDYHEHYYINESATGVGAPFVYGVSGIRSKTYYFDGMLYVMTDDSSLTLSQYSLTSPGYDVSLTWTVSGLLGTSTRGHGDSAWGAFTASGDQYVYSYVTDNTDILLRKLDRPSGALAGSIVVTGFNSALGSVKIDQTSTSDIFIAHCDGDTLRLATYDFATATLTPSQTVGTDVSMVQSMHSHSDASGRGHCTLLYNASANIVLVDSMTQTHHGVREFGMPTIYSINKDTRFSEGEASLYMDITASCKHAVNPNILFFAYVTPERFIRVLKLYRYLPPGDSRYVYVILWATVANSTASAFYVNSYGGDIEEYNHTNTDVSSLMMTTDDCGHVFVFAQDSSTPAQTLKIWKIREYLLDLGHDHLGDVTLDPHILQRALHDITDYYNITTWEPSFHFGDLPSVGDVIVTDISLGGSSSGYGRTVNVTLRYLNYNIIQFDREISQALATGLTGCFRAMHNREDINLLNFNISAGVMFEGDEITLTAKFPALNIIKPCVLRGTEIVRYSPSTGRAHLTNIEDIVAGDLVANQDGRPVRVLAHRCNKILTDSWTAPYIVPRDYFGRDQPYHPLFISGDHGIKYGRQRLYACRMKGAFRRLPEQSIVEYHHLLLEDDEHNFYIANGLLVESLHGGVYPLG